MLVDVDYFKSSNVVERAIDTDYLTPEERKTLFSGADLTLEWDSKGEPVAWVSLQKEDH